MGKEQGFTLIEVLVAMVILLISFTILVQGFITINDSLERNRQYTYLTSWSESKLNEIVTGIELSYYGSFHLNDVLYNWYLREEYLEQNLQEITLIIEWIGRRGQQSYQQTRIFIP